MPGKDNFCALAAGPWNVTVPGDDIEAYAELDAIVAKFALLANATGLLDGGKNGTKNGTVTLKM